MEIKGCLVAILCLVCLTAITVGAEATDFADNGSDEVKVIGEMLAGGAGSAAGFLLVRGISRLMKKDLFLLTVLAGVPTGSAIGVYVFGSIGNESGIFPTTLMGSALGAAVGGASALIMLSWNTENPRFARGILIGAAVGAAIGATIFFNLTNEHESSASANRQMSPAVPLIYLNLAEMRF